MREIVAYKFIWFVFYVSLPDKIKLLLFDIFFFNRTKPTDIKIQDPGPTHACLEIAINIVYNWKVIFEGGCTVET